MGKLVIVISSLCTCVLGFGLLVSHDISDLCYTRTEQYYCDSWDSKAVGVYALAYLTMGVLLGWGINCVVAKAFSWREKAVKAAEMSWIKDRLLLIIFSILALVLACLFWRLLGKYSFCVFSFIAFYAFLVEVPKLRKKRSQDKE